MTVTQVIEMLQGIEGDDEVMLFDPDTNEWQTVTGCTYGGGDKRVQLYCDGDGEEEDV